MAAGQKKRSRKPNEPARKGTRFQVNILLSAAAKDHIVAAAKASGRTTSSEAEHLIERARTVDRLMDAMRTDLAQIERGNIQAVLHRLGYMPVRDLATGKMAWCEPGHPAIVCRSGFEEWKPGELQTAGISDEETERRNREKLQAADERPNWAADAAFDRLAEIEEAAGLATPKKDDDAA